MGKPSTITGTPDELERRVGPADAVAIGPGAMIGAGIFAALAPARGPGRAHPVAAAAGRPWPSSPPVPRMRADRSSVTTPPGPSPRTSSPP